MTNAYLLEVIKAMTPEERQEALQSLTHTCATNPAHGQEWLQLYQIILEAWPAFEEKGLTKEKVYAALFPRQPLVHGRLEKVMAELNKHLRLFLLSQQYLAVENAPKQQLDWVAWLRERGLAERSRQALTKLKNQHEKSGEESLEKYQALLQLAKEEHEWESMHNKVKGDLKIPQLLEYLEIYYLNYKTSLLNVYLVQQKVTRLPDLRFPTTVIPDGLSEKSILLFIVKEINDLLRQDPPSVQAFEYLVQLLTDHEAHLSFQTRVQCYTYLRNFCTLLINAGSIALYPVLHRINKNNLERGYFFFNEKMVSHAYLNLVLTALAVGELSWAKTFTEDFRGRIIGETESDFFYHLCMANCLFAERDFDRALSFMPDTPSQFYYHQTVRRLELKIYYEMGSDLLMYKIDAFRKFVERTAPKIISGTIREMNLNFLKILLQLTQSPPKDKTRSARLIQRIEAKKLIADRSWLLEKARELG